jgi:hypothetical protein
MTPRNLVIATLAVFILGVAGLTFGGKNFLQGLEQADATISFLDMARQATQHRDYQQADGFYKQAISFAQTTDKRRENMVLALGAYSDFLRLKRNPLKDVKRAHSLEVQALAISHGTY